MGAAGDFPIDLVILGGVALFLILRLRSILGRREGFERPTDATRTADPRAQGNTAMRPAEAAAVQPQASSRIVPDPATPAGQGLAEIHAIDQSVRPDQFLDGAEGAFRIIVAAFAAGDRVALRPLLSDDTYRAFETAIAARETAGETQRTEIRAIPAATIEHAALHDRTGSIIVRFVSDQVNITLDHAGNPVVGTDAVTEITDLWTFERALGTSDPAWRLAAARSA